MTQSSCGCIHITQLEGDWFPQQPLLSYESDFAAPRHHRLQSNLNQVLKFGLTHTHCPFLRTCKSRNFGNNVPTRPTCEESASLRIELSLVKSPVRSERDTEIFSLFAAHLKNREERYRWIIGSEEYVLPPQKRCLDFSDAHGLDSCCHQRDVMMITEHHLLLLLLVNEQR